MMKLQRIPEIIPGDPILSRVSWADPTYMLATSQWITNDFTIVINTTERIAINNPRRWAIGFAMSPPTVNTIQVAPWEDAQAFGKLITVDFRDSWYTIFEHGPMVCGEWYGFTNFGNSVRVVEVTIQ